jgi:pimeloyl-ACP methyl ester carboxylesterase
VIGNLKTWDIAPDLHKITAPTLVLNGEFDEARDSCVYPYFEHIPKVKWLTLKGASHMSNVEIPQVYMDTVSRFLQAPAV